MHYLPCVEKELHTDTRAADAAVIWLHGLGANGHDFEPIVPELGLPSSLAVRFIFPHAPEIPVTINGGMVMPAWYDILEMNIDRKIDEQQILASSEKIRALIDREIARGVESDRIIIAGFSQGGAVAYQCALTFEKPLAGLLALSTYFATEKTIFPSEANKALNTYVMHGDFDPVVPAQLGERAVARLKEMGYPTTYSTYPMEHQVCMQQIKAIGVWMTQRLG